jgi:hypothetical protein
VRFDVKNPRATWEKSRVWQWPTMEWGETAIRKRGRTKTPIDAMANDHEQHSTGEQRWLPGMVNTGPKGHLE